MQISLGSACRKERASGAMGFKSCFTKKKIVKHRKKTLKILRFKLQGAQLTSNDDSPGSQISQSSLIYSGQRWMDPLAMGF